MNLVNMAVSMTIGFARAQDWWCFIVVPICLNVGLNLFSWRFAQVIFPNDTPDLGLELEREHQQLIPLIMEAIQKVNEHLDVLSVNLNDYEAAKKAIEDVGKRLGNLLDSVTHKDAKIPAFLLARERQLYPRMKEDRRTAKEYKAALYSILDKKKCVTSLGDYKTLKDEKIPAFLLGRVEKLNQLTTDAIRSADEYQDALSSILDANDCFATQLDSKILEYAKIPVLLQEMKQHLNQLEMEATRDAEGNAVASAVIIQTMENADTGWPSPDMTEPTSPVSGGDRTFNFGR